MQGPLYKIYFRNSQGYYLFQDELGTIQFSADKRAIVNAPDGWMQMVASIIRNKTYKGCFRKVATPLKFVGDGKAIIDYIAVYEGVNAFVELIIEVQTPENFGYELFFHGTMDFEEGYQYGIDFSTINIREVLMLDLIEAKKDVVYSIPLTDENSGWIQMDGLNLLYKTLYIVSDSFGTTSNWNTGRHIVELIEASNENPYARPTVRTKYDNHPADLFGTGQPFYTSQVKATIKITYNFKIRATWLNSGTIPGPGSLLRFRITTRKPDGTYISNLDNDIFTVSGQDNVFSVSYLSGKDHEISGVYYATVNAGESLYLSCLTQNMALNGEACQVSYYPQPAEISVESVQRAPATLHRFIRPWKVWQELMYKASDGKYSGTSPFLFNDMHQVLLPGTSLRKDPNPVLQTKISDFLKYVWVNKRGVIKDVSGNNALIAEYSETYKPGEFENMGEVSDFRWEFDKDALVSSIVVGYENIDFGVDGQINGRDEFNQKNYFTTGQETIDATYEIVSPYIASMYAQELMRVNFGKRQTTDNKGDNKVYLVDAIQGADVQYYSGSVEFRAPNQIVLQGTLSDVTGRTLKLSGAGSYDGDYAITGISYLQAGYSILFTTASVFNVSIGGTLTYVDLDVWKPYRPTYASISGVLFPETAYNTRISPKNILLLNAHVIAAGVYNVNASDSLDQIKFQSGDKNTSLSVSFDGITFITENADERFSQLNQPFTLPIVFNFKTDYSKDMFARFIGDKRYERLSFMVNGILLTGYIEEIHTNADNREEQTWKLKSVVNTNLINLLQWRRL